MFLVHDETRGTSVSYDFSKQNCNFRPKVQGTSGRMSLLPETGLNILEDFTFEKSYHSVITFFVCLGNQVLFVLTLDLIEMLCYYFCISMESWTLTLNRPGGGAESAHRLVLPSAVLKR